MRREPGAGSDEWVMGEAKDGGSLHEKGGLAEASSDVIPSSPETDQRLAEEAEFKAALQETMAADVVPESEGQAAAKAAELAEQQAAREAEEAEEKKTAAERNAENDRKRQQAAEARLDELKNMMSADDEPANSTPETPRMTA